MLPLERADRVVFDLIQNYEPGSVALLNPPEIVSLGLFENNIATIEMIGFKVADPTMDGIFG